MLLMVRRNHTFVVCPNITLRATKSKNSLSEQIPAWYTPITEKMLRNMKRRIVEEFQPEKIIFFGSYTYGQPQFHSDIDLLVITNRHRRKSVFERDRLVAKVARPPGVAMDVIVRSLAEVAYRLKIGDPFFPFFRLKTLDNFKVNCYIKIVLPVNLAVPFFT